MDAAVGFPGYRHHLLDRFAAWTRDERKPNGPPPGGSPVESEEWALFGHYRATLAGLDAEDPEGWAVWASRELVKAPPPGFRRLGHVVAIDPVAPGRAVRRVLDYCHGRVKSMLVTLPFDPDPALAELYAAVEPRRLQLLEAGFVEEPVGPGTFDFRDHRFGAIERELFRSDAHLRPRLDLGGLKILGGPRGEGLGLLIAREVRAELESGRHPEDILILVPRMDEDAELVRATLRAWGLPVAAGPGRRLSTSPAVSALRLAIRLPAEGWDVATLTRLLRNVQVRWADGPGFARFEAASAIRATRVFRDRDHLRKALARPVEGDGRKDDRGAEAARAALERLSALIDPLARPGRWRAQVDRLGAMADGLGLDPADVEPLWDALEDQAWVLGGLGPAIAEAAWSWAEFAAEVDAIVAEAAPPAPPPTPGAIRIEAVGAVEGARAAVVILANLGEKTFPTPGAVDLDPQAAAAVNPDDTEADDDVTGRPNLAYSREMLRFARAVGSADSRLILAYPTSDLNGEELLPAGFLDELLRRLGPATRADCVEIHARFDPVLADHPMLAGSPADARVLAVALACRDGGTDRLRDLAASPRHALALAGTADAFRVAQVRREGSAFGPYEGRIGDPAAIAKIREAFGPEHHFSASQLESFALCPFQFFQRYALGLKLVDELDELGEDYAGRGREVHRALEELHQQMAAEGSGDLIAMLPVLIETSMRAELDRFDDGEADVAEVLREIEARRNARALGRYSAQFLAYSRKLGEGAEPHRFEVKFGQPDQPDSLPHLSIGEGAAAFRLQGVIDRIDLVPKDGKVAFRVIDYKTGSHPPGGDVKSGLASQLPLYALAVEQLVLASGEHSFEGLGYWSLPKDGFRGVNLGDWGGYRDRLTAFVLALVAELRGGAFPISSQKKGCPKFCDFHSVCRVKEVRVLAKVWVDRPTLEAGS